jgi:hypothetical protein
LGSDPDFTALGGNGMNSTEIFLSLNLRGVRLAQPASLAELNNLKNVSGVHFSDFFIELYSKFNGFNAYDEKSQILLWSSSKILEMLSQSKEYFDNIYVPFGDILIDSDQIMICPDNENFPIFLLYENREIALSAAHFFDKLSAGRFDFFNIKR